MGMENVQGSNGSNGHNGTELVKSAPSVPPVKATSKAVKGTLVSTLILGVKASELDVEPDAAFVEAISGAAKNAHLLHCVGNALDDEGDEDRAKVARDTYAQQMGAIKSLLGKVLVQRAEESGFLKARAKK